MGTAHPPAQPARPGAVLQGAVPGVPRRAPRGLPAPRLRGCSVPVRAALAVPGGALSAAVGRAPERRGCAPPRPPPPPIPRLQMEASSGGQSRGGSGLVGRNKSARIAPTAPRQRCPRPRAASGAARIWAAFPVPPPSRASVSRPDPPAERRGSEGSAARSRAWRGHAGTRLRSAAAPRSPPAAGSCQATRDGGEARTKPQREPPLSPPRTHGLFPRRNWGGGGGGVGCALRERAVGVRRRAELRGAAGGGGPRVTATLRPGPGAGRCRAGRGGAAAPGPPLLSGARARAEPPPRAAPRRPAPPMAPRGAPRP